MPKFMVTLTISPSSEGTAHHRHECKPVHATERNIPNSEGMTCHRHGCKPMAYHRHGCNPMTYHK